MYLYKVIPLTRIPKLDLETPVYFSGDSFSVGQLVEVPLGKRKIPAVILSAIPAEKQKQEVKKYSFQLKSIEKPLTDKPLFSKEFLKTANSLADYYYVSIGFMLQRMLPPFFSKPNRPLLKMLKDLPDIDNITKRSPKKTLLVSGKRIQFYKKLLKENKAIFLVPEYAQLAVAKKSAEKEDLAIVDQSTTPAKLRDIWGKAYSGKVKILAGTRSILFTPLKGNGLIVVENQNNDSHVSWDQHPKFDARHAAELLSDNMGVDIVEGDIMPSINAYWKAKKQKWEIIEEKHPVSSKISIVDMREELNNSNFSILSRNLEGLLKGLGENGQAILFISRRGLASALVCRDCGYMPKCPECESPLVLHNYRSGAGNRALICHQCGIKKVPPIVCPNCKSGRIKFLGGGTQLIEKQVNKAVPALKTAVLDSDSVKGQKDAEEILNDFSEGKFNVLIGTNLMLKDQLLPEVEHSAVVMMDTVINLPLHDAYERVFNTALRIRLKTKNEMVVQTYHPELSVFKHIENNNYKEFFNEEIKKRKALFLPPFSHIVRISYAHKNKAKTESEAHALRRRLETQLKHLGHDDLTKLIRGPAPGFKEKKLGKYYWYLTIKWPNSEDGSPKDLGLRNKLLEAVPGEWEIVIDPIDVL